MEGLASLFVGRVPIREAFAHFNRVAKGGIVQQVPDTTTTRTGEKA
jgi:hypothetical protein